MTNSIKVYLPLNTWISVRGFTNAAFLQQACIVNENSNTHVMTGSGEHDAPMQNGVYAFTTPDTSKNPAGYEVTVSIQTEQGNQWLPSKLTSGKVSLAYYNMAMVVSEDATDNDYNDAVVQFSWWTQANPR